MTADPEPDRWAVARIYLHPPGEPWEVLVPTIFHSFASALTFASALDDALVYQLELVQVVHGG